MLSKSPSTIFNRKVQLTTQEPASEKLSAVFSDINLCGLILAYVSDEDFLSFGHACRSLHDIVVQNPRYYVLGQNFNLKTHFSENYYQAFYTKVLAKYLNPKGLYLTTNMLGGNRYANISDWLQPAHDCFTALNASLFAFRLTNLQRQAALSEIQKLMRCVATVLPGTTLPFTDFAQKLQSVQISPFNRDIIATLLKLTDCIAAMTEAKREDFKSLSRNTTTSFFADFYALLDMGKLNFQYLNKEVNQAVTTNRFTFHRNAMDRGSRNLQTLNRVKYTTLIAVALWLMVLAYLMSTRSKYLRTATVLSMLTYIFLKVVQITGMISNRNMQTLEQNRPRIEELPENQIEPDEINPNL